MPNKRKRKTNKAYQAQYAAAPRRAVKNKERRLLKHMEKHPNDKQATSGAKPDYTRRKPLTYWEQLAKGRK